MSDCSAEKHGTATAYQAYGCRCQEARDAQRRYKKKWQRDKDTGRARKVDATGTHRRIQALMANGWSLEQIMERAGYHNSGNWIRYDATTLHVKTAARVAAVYDVLWDKPGPSKWTRTWARNRGYLPPMAWDDDTIDDPSAWADLGAEQGDHIDHVVVDTLVDRYPYADWRALNATRTERLAALERLDHRDQRARLRALGWQDSQIDLPSVDAVLRYLGLRYTDAQWGAA